MRCRTTRLGNLANFRNGLNFNHTNLGNGLKVINVADFQARSTPDYASLGQINPLGVADEHDLLVEGDIIFVRSNGNRELVGRSMLIRNPPEAVSHSAFTIRLRFTTPSVSPAFYSYLFRSPLFRSLLSLRGVGTNISNLNQRVLADMDVPQPDLAVQERIAATLGAYDDLIENNRRRMALLEEAARLLYREWFVHLRFPGYEHARITNGVPAGWKRAPVEQLATLLTRGIAPAYDDSADGLVINQKCIRGGRLDMSLARRQSREFKSERQVQVGDVLVNSTGEGTLGRVAQVVVPVPNCTVDTHVTIVRPIEGVGHCYFGQALREWEPRFSTMGRGATNQTELSRDQIGETEILVPTCSLMMQFEDVADPLCRQVSTLMEQNERLRAARDLLLPRLMTGEIAV